MRVIVTSVMLMLMLMLMLMRLPPTTFAPAHAAATSRRVQWGGVGGWGVGKRPVGVLAKEDGSLLNTKP